MNEDLQLRITMFFDYWRGRYNFINNLDKTKHYHEANVLLWASLDALSNLWAENIGKEKCRKRILKGKRIIFDAFLAEYGGDLFKTVSLSDVWYRVDQGNVWIDQKNKLKLSDDVSTFLSKIGGRQTPPFIDIKEQGQTRQTSDDLSLDEIINTTLGKYPDTNCIELEEWLTLSRYGAIAYKEMRNAYIHEGRSGKGTHGFNLYGSSIRPTYLSWIYTTPPIIGFKVEFMLCVLKQCLDEFETEALALQKDPVPKK